MVSWKRLRRTTEGTSGPVAEEYVQRMDSESPPLSPSYQQLVEACETVVAALPVCTCSWDSLHSLSLVPRPPGTRLSFSNGGGEV